MAGLSLESSVYFQCFKFRQYDYDNDYDYDMIMIMIMIMTMIMIMIMIMIMSIGIRVVTNSSLGINNHVLHQPMIANPLLVHFASNTVGCMWYAHQPKNK
jgi:hypothetical protein